MDRQRKYQLLFGVFVRCIGACRYTWAHTPLLAGLAVCMAGLAANPWSPATMPAQAGSSSNLAPAGSSSTLTPTWPSSSESANGVPAPGALASAFTPVPPPSLIPPGVVASTQAASALAPVLSREQQNVVRFIAKTYQVAVEQTQWFVEHSYRAARDLKMDPMLILAIISVESSFDPRAQSHRGAQGLMQVLTRVHAEKFSAFGGVAAAFDPMANIRVGAQILSDYLKREGSVEGALKSYVGAATLPHDGGYGAKVSFERERLAAAAAGRPVPAAPTLATPPAEAAPGGETLRAIGSLAGEAARSAARGVSPPVTDSPLLLPPAAPPADSTGGESAPPLAPVARSSGDA